MTHRQRIIISQFVTITLLCLCAVTAYAQGTTAFTYQGRLNDAGEPANGAYDLLFTPYDANAAGTQIGASVVLEDVAVTNGVFTVQLDFGAAAFNGAARHLEIGVRPGADTGTFTTLTPRSPFTPTPYAIRSQNAASADNATQLNGLAAGQYVQTNDPRLSDDRNPTSNFSISGDGTAARFSATVVSGSVVTATSAVNSPVYQINGVRILSAAGTNNFFAGVSAGANNSTGANNSFFGTSAGFSSTTGGENAFFGTSAGASNGPGNSNSFFGFDAGVGNSGSFNTFIGRQAGLNATSGAGNVFLGNDTGANNSTGSSNTLVGSGANVLATGQSFATAIGAGATTGDNNTITFGRANGADRVRMPGGMGGALLLNSNALFLRGVNDNQSIFGSTTEVTFNSANQFVWSIPGVGTRMVLTNNGDLTITGTYGSSSDVRYKTNIQTYAGGLGAIMRLRGVTYNWKPELKRSSRLQIGFIAQEVEEVLPELVTTDTNGYKSVNYSNAVPVLVEAMKQQQVQIEKLENENAEFKMRFAEQQVQIEELRQIVCAANPNAGLCKEQK